MLGTKHIRTCRFLYSRQELQTALGFPFDPHMTRFYTLTVDGAPTFIVDCLDEKTLEDFDQFMGNNRLQVTLLGCVEEEMSETFYEISLEGFLELAEKRLTSTP